MQPGKLPPDILARLVASATIDDPRVILGPRVGEDAAAVDLGDGRVLVLKSDPITFASDRIGWYAVHVNANDVATMGAKPSFFLATLLLPETFDEAAIEPIFGQIRDACAQVGAVLVGGHTEVTHGIEAPILAGSMVGEATRESLILTAGARPGDVLLLTKGIAIEGTSVLGRDAAEALSAAGVPAATIDAAARLLESPGISVVKDCAIAIESADVHAMHDPTEGGLAAALYEMSLACGAGLEVELDAVSVLPETVAVANALKLDPLGMLASGSLLAAVSPETAPAALAALHAAGIAAAAIGRVTEPGDAVILKAPEGKRRLGPTYQDEVARFLATLEE